jgi:hypothetical protein
MHRRTFLKGLGALIAAPVLGETFSRLVPAEPRVYVEAPPLPNGGTIYLPPGTYPIGPGGLNSLQALIDETARRGGGIVPLEPKTYRIDEPLRIPGGVHLYEATVEWDKPLPPGYMFVEVAGPSAAIVGCRFGPAGTFG